MIFYFTILLASIIFFTPILIGIFITGYFGIYEILLEYFFILFVAMFPSEFTDKKGIYGTIMNFLSNKIKLILNAKKGFSFSVAIKLALAGIIFGCVITLFRLFFTDPATVIAMEMQQIVLAFFVIFPFAFMLSRFVDFDFTRNLENEEKELENLPSFLDENAIKDYIYKGVGLAGAVLVRYMNIMTISTQTLALIFLYFFGYFSHSLFPIQFLDSVRDWRPEWIISIL